MLKNIEIKDFTYNLPDDKIAKYPKENRSESKLLIYQKGKIQETGFNSITKLFSKDDLLVFNNTKVIRARLNFFKYTGAKIEIFCLEPSKPADYQLSFDSRNSCSWKCLAGNIKKWKSGRVSCKINIQDEEFELYAEKGEQINDSVIINFIWENQNFSFADILENAGNTPIPPYLNRLSEDIDNTRYQTVYSKHKGSVAAPTAGLHFTDEILQTIKEQGTCTEYITLHVGAGTFKPVKCKVIGDHEMHSEHFEISIDTIKNLKKYSGKITAVGTTSVRTLESIYHIGVNFINKKFTNQLSQWECYENPNTISPEDALTAIENYLTESGKTTLQAQTQIMIVPTYKFRMVNRIITNFHQPQSTLLLLISAYVGDDWKKIYNYALENDFRFLSYGDSSILISDL